MEWRFEAKLFVGGDGDGSWHFVRLPVDVADDVRECAGYVGGFGSVRVSVTLGDTTWATSVFPEKSSGSYVLPVKRAVRQAAGVSDGDVVAVRLSLSGDSSTPSHFKV